MSSAAEFVFILLTVVYAVSFVCAVYQNVRAINSRRKEKKSNSSAPTQKT